MSDEQILELIKSRKGPFGTSYVQRRARIGYNRATRFIEQALKDGKLRHPERKGAEHLVEVV